MGRMSIEERRRLLVAATLRVVAARGLAGASTRAIVADAGMSLASFHYAFESRDEVIDLLIPEVLAREATAILPVDLSGKSMTELIAEALAGYLALLRADPAHEQAMLELTQYALRERLPLAREQYANYTRFAVAALKQAAHATDQRWSVPVTVVATMLVSLTDGLTLTWLVNRDDALAEQVIQAVAISVASLAEPRSDAEEEGT